MEPPKPQKPKGWEGAARRDDILRECTVKNPSASLHIISHLSTTILVTLRSETVKQRVFFSSSARAA